MIDWTKLIYLPKENAWMLDIEDSHLEILVDGNQEGAFPERLALAKQVMGNIQHLEQEASRYLDMFVSPKFKGTAIWSMVGVDFGSEHDLKTNEFLLWIRLEGESFTDSDKYGSWYVKFRFLEAGANKSFPVGFGRIET